MGKVGCKKLIYLFGFLMLLSACTLSFDNKKVYAAARYSSLDSFYFLNDIPEDRQYEVLNKRYCVIFFSDWNDYGNYYSVHVVSSDYPMTLVKRSLSDSSGEIAFFAGTDIFIANYLFNKSDDKFYSVYSPNNYGVSESSVITCFSGVPFNIDAVYNMIFYSNFDIYYDDDFIFGQDDYLLYANAVDTEGKLFDNLNFRVIYKTSESSELYMLAADMAFDGELLSGDRIHIDSWSSNQYYFKWDEYSKKWVLEGKDLDGITTYRDLILASTHNITDMHDSSKVLVQAFTGGLHAPEGTDIINPGIVPDFMGDDIPRVKNFKVTYDGAATANFIDLSSFKLSWDPVYTNCFIEVRIKATIYDKQRVPIDNILNNPINDYEDVIVVPYYHFVDAGLGSYKLSYSDIKGCLKDENKNDWYIVTEVDLRYVAKAHNKFYCNSWACAKLTYDMPTGKVIKNEITYQDPDGNQVDDDTYENIIGDLNGQAWDGSGWDITDTDFGNLSMTDVIRISTDMVKVVGSLPQLFQKLLIFIPSDIWNLLFFGIGLIIVLRVLGR